MIKIPRHQVRIIMDIIPIPVMDSTIEMAIMVENLLKNLSNNGLFSVILDEKYSTQVSHTTSKEEMNVDLTPKKHRDFCKPLKTRGTSRTV